MSGLTLKQKLQNNQLTIGSWLTIGHQSVVEIMASAGFEWLTIDLEHSAINIETCRNLIGHIQGNGMKALVRVSKNEEVIIKQVMDAGADGVVVPMVKSRAEAEQAVSFVKYPPVGNRGVGLSRAQKYGIGFEEYKKWVNEEAVIIVQVEHIQAVNELEDILSVDGVDGIIVGPYDLSASMGFPGEFDRPEVQEALKRVEQVTKSMNRPLGTHVIPSKHEDLQASIDKGYTFIAFSLDFFFLGDRAREEMGKVK